MLFQDVTLTVQKFEDNLIAFGETELSQGRIVTFSWPCDTDNRETFGKAQNLLL